MSLPVCTWSPICSSDIATDLLFLSWTRAMAGKQRRRPPPDGAAVVAVVVVGGGGGRGGGEEVVVVVVVVVGGGGGGGAGVVVVVVGAGVGQLQQRALSKPERDREGQRA